MRSRFDVTEAVSADGCEIVVARSPIRGWRGSGADSMPVKWYLLITEMEEVHAETGWGLAGTMGLVQQGKYAEAVCQFEASKQMLREMGRLKDAVHMVPVRQTAGLVSSEQARASRSGTP